MQLNGTTAGAQHDRLNVTGSVALAGNLNVSLGTGYTPAIGDQFVILTNDSNDPISGTFNGLPQNGLVNYGGNIFQISYTGGGAANGNNDVVLTTQAVNHFPFGNAQNLTTVEETPLSITLTGSDLDGDPFTFSIATNPAHGTLTGSGANRTYTPNPNFAGNDSFVFQVTDNQGGFGTATVSIAVTNTQDPPVSISLSNSNINENTPIGITIGNFSTNDPDIGDTFTYSLVSGSGSSDNSSFTIVGNELRTLFSPDYEVKGSYSVRVRSTDAAGAYVERSFTITITNVNEVSTEISLSPQSIAENSPANTVVGVLSSLDPDAGDTFVYSLVAGLGSTDNAAFTITGNQLSLSNIADFETKSTYDIRVRSTDSGNLSIERTFSVTVLDINESPVINNNNLSLSATNIIEGQSASLTGSFTDPDGGDSHVVTIHWNDGSDPTVLNLAAGVFNFSIVHAFLDDQPTNTAVDLTQISVVVDDGEYSDSATISLTINNAAPSVSNQTVTSPITENGVATLTATISDPGQADSYTLVVNWGEGSNQAYSIPAGSTSFSVTHQYLDDNPTVTSSDTYPVTIVSFVDDDGGSAGIIQGGSIFLTGHDILSHTPNAQNHFDDVILDYLRGKGTALEIARADYTIGLYRSAIFTPGATPNGPAFGSVLTPTTGQLASESAFRGYLSTIDVLVLPEDSNTTLLDTYSDAIEDFFNAGGDLFLDTSNGASGYYNFLPSVIGANGPAINQSSGFVATPAGVAIGITNSMINGFPTHNSFTNPSSFLRFLKHILWALFLSVLRA